MTFDDVAVIVRSVIDYRTAEMCDVQAFTAKARSAGACVVWDLSHTAGAAEFDVHKLGVDIAVGCTYKFLNGGPGAPAWAYVSKELHARMSPPIRGWFAHRDQFAMEGAFVPHDDARRLLIGTPHILSLVAAEEGIALVVRAGMPAIATKGRALVDFGFQAADFFSLPTMTPRDPLKRGCHLAIRNTDAAEIVKTLAQHHGVIADSRPPDVIRLGMSPLTTRFTDVWDGIERISQLIASEAMIHQGHDT
jgi:kynureninase